VLDAGKLTGIFAVNPSISGRYVDMGYRFIALGTEAAYMALGAADLIGRARASIKWVLPGCHLSRDRKLAKAMDPSGQGP
jgi:hypothetical protein